MLFVAIFIDYHHRCDINSQNFNDILYRFTPYLIQNTGELKVILVSPYKILRLNFFYIQ